MTDRETLSEILRKALLAGQSVEIDGLGIFQASPGGYEFLPQTTPRSFRSLCCRRPSPSPPPLRSPARRRLLPLARQRQTPARPKLAPRHRTRDRGFRHLRSLLLPPLRPKTRPVPKRAALCSRLRPQTPPVGTRRYRFHSPRTPRRMHRPPPHLRPSPIRRPLPRLGKRHPPPIQSHPPQRPRKASVSAELDGHSGRYVN